MVKCLGQFRFLLFEVLHAIITSEQSMLRADNPLLEGVFNSTLQIIMVWSCESVHNNIFSCKALDFFRTYASRASEVSLCNAFIRTSALMNLAQYYIDRLQSKKAMMVEEKMNLESMIEVFIDPQVAKRSPRFVEDLQQSTVWRFAVHLKM